MNWRRAPSRDRAADVNMTPMIDVVFLLLIFFICTANLQVIEELLPTNLLVQGTTVADTIVEESPLEQIVVYGNRAGATTVWQVNEGATVSRNQISPLLKSLAAIDRSLPVILDVDGEVPLGDMIDVYDECRAAGLEQIQFAASAN